jgi:hypothetical protein
MFDVLFIGCVAIRVHLIDHSVLVEKRKTLDLVLVDTNCSTLSFQSPKGKGCCFCFNKQKNVFEKRQKATKMTGGLC